MGLNAKEIQLRLCRVFQVSIDTIYIFIRRHPLVSSAFLVLFILYAFLSYIYSFLVYLSPFIVCTAIFIRIFWSSEQPQLRYVKREARTGEKKRNEKKHPRVPKYGRRDMVFERSYTFSPQQPTNRRRPFRERKWGLHGGIEEKAKTSSTAYNNDFTNSVSERNTENKEVNRQPLRSEPSMRDLLMDYDLEELKSRFDGFGGSELETENIEDGDDEDEETQDDRNIKAVEWTENDQKNLLDLGFSEIERNRRLETLVARRRASKHLKMQIEKGLADTKNVNPGQIPPPFVTRNNLIETPKEFEDVDGLEMPSSAPSVLRLSRNIFGHAYHPSEEKPIFMEDASGQKKSEGHQKDIFCRNESFSLGSSFPLEPLLTNGRKVSKRLGYDKFRRVPGKGHHDWLIEQMFSKADNNMQLSGSNFDSDHRELNPPKPQSNREETTYQVDRKNETDMVDEKGKEWENAHATKSSLDHVSTQNDQNISSVEKAEVSEKRESRVQKPREKFNNFSISNSTSINESLFDSFPSPIEKHRENMSSRRICNTPTYSIASDLQVEVSEIGSPTLTADGTNTTTDGESEIYDGDNEKDVTSGSEDMWGNSVHSREVHGISDEDIAEVNSKSKDTTLPMPLQEIDEENSADVSSMSSTSDIPGDTPTYPINHSFNIFYNMKEPVVENEASQPLKSSYVSSSQKQFIDSSMDSAPRGTHSEKPEGRRNPLENFTNEAQDVNDVNNSAATEKDDTDNIIRNQDPGPSNFRQESINQVTVNSNSGFSLRSVLAEKTLTDNVSSSASDQQIHILVPQSNMENMEQTTSISELTSQAMPLNLQPSINDPTVQSHNGDFNYSQVTPDSLMLESFSQVHKENEGESQILKRQEAKMEPSSNAKTEDSRSAKDSEGKQDGLYEKEAIASSGSVGNSHKLSETTHSEEPSKLLQLEDSKPSKPDKQKDSLEEVSNLQSQSKTLVENDMEKGEVTIGNNTKDSPQPMVNKVTNLSSIEDTEEKSDKVNKREAIEQELNKKEAMIPSRSVGDSDKVIKTANMENPGEVIQLEDAKVVEPGKQNDNSNKLGSFQSESKELVEDDMEKDKTASSEIKDLQPQPMVSKPTIPSKEANDKLAEDS